MPQMAPLNWISLMIYFLMIFLTVNILTYYNNLTYPKLMKMNKYMSKFNWKW